MDGIDAILGGIEDTRTEVRALGAKVDVIGAKVDAQGATITGQGTRIADVAAQLAAVKLDAKRANDNALEAQRGVSDTKTELRTVTGAMTAHAATVSQASQAVVRKTDVLQAETTAQTETLKTISLINEKQVGKLTRTEWIGTVILAFEIMKMLLQAKGWHL